MSAKLEFGFLTLKMINNRLSPSVQSAQIAEFPWPTEIILS